MLTTEQTEFFWEQGYLHIPAVFTPQETDGLAGEMNRLMQEWANRDQGWVGPWRKVYMDEETEKKSKLVAMHDLWYYSAAWMHAVTNPRLVGAMVDLLGEDVELHHSTMHVKPPETGHPFPVHQDNAFYGHSDNRYIDCLVHLDDTCHENGEIRFTPGSHKQGPLEHVTKNPDGSGCTPHLPTDQYKLEDTVAVPAKRGDVVCFNIFTIHGSYLNQTAVDRRLVRVGYRHPENHQQFGQSVTRPPVMVSGKRARKDGQSLYTTEAPLPAEPAVAG
ncbi:MAG: phytanoyl-CoA dioxygenase family protein [Verrucomicrobia bacterium]|nr:phytanoyl-CoA dioxygenase family protein [Verrucomicrobiota bacterium]MDA1086288.1 phytanoyl-CoA dioxygenase family protein [Verrucomicrobiota bacterium]